MHNIKPIADSDESIDRDGATRRERCRANAVNRLRSRHVERDYFGRPIPSAAEQQAILHPVSAAAAKGGTRLDTWLVNNGYAASREKAKELIATGAVTVTGVATVKGSTVVMDDAQVEVCGSGENEILD